MQWPFKLQAYQHSLFTLPGWIGSAKYLVLTKPIITLLNPFIFDLSLQENVFCQKCLVKETFDINKTKCKNLFDKMLI